MLSFDSSTVTSLGTATTKTDWANKLITALTIGPLLLKCYWDSAGGTDPTASGTLFFQATLTGTPTVSGGAITSFGVTSSSTQSTADLTVGTAMLMLTSTSGPTTHWMKATLGLTGTVNDYTLSQNVTSTSVGLGFLSAMTVSGPITLPSGTGPVAPSLSSASPTSLLFQDWSNPGSPTTIGTLTFDTVLENMVFEDAEIASDVGDVKVVQCSQSIIFGEFEFGATLLAMNAVNNLTDPTKPLYQIMIACKPHKIWPTYPFEDTRLDILANTIPNPLKILVYDGSSSLMHTFQMRDGLAINDVAQSEYASLINNDFLSTATACRPYFNSAMMLVWQSGQTTVSSHASKYLPGFLSDALRPTQVAPCAFAFLSIEQLINIGANPNAGGFGTNSLQHWYALPQWPFPQDTTSNGGAPAIATIDYPQTDANTSWVGTYHAFENTPVRLIGWDYEPGSFSGHNWYTAPGGPRSDRLAIPTPLAFFITSQTYARPRGQVPIRTLCDAWGLAYFNQSYHYILDVKTLAGLPAQGSLNGDYAYMGAYYGGGPFDTMTTNVHLLATPNSGTWSFFDKNNRRAWSGWALDSLHCYAQPGLWTMFFNSPMHAVASRIHYPAPIMGLLGSRTPANSQTEGYLQREGAWELLNYVIAWKVSTKHTIGQSRDWVEARVKIALEAVYDKIYVPAMINNANDIYSQGIRNLGMGCMNVGTANAAWLIHDSKALYHALLLVLMKQTGFWSRARALSPKCATVLDFIIRCLDLFTIDWMLATNGWPEANSFVPPVSPILPDGQSNYVVYANWAAYNTANPPTGSQDWIRNTAGQVDGGVANATNTMHMKATWVFMRRDYFPEYPNANLTTAINKYQQYYTDYLAAFNGGTMVNGLQDWQYRMPGFCMLAAPAVLGPQ